MGNLIYMWPLLLIPLAVLVCWLVDQANAPKRVKRPVLWTPAKLALVEHETGVHPLRRACAEDGCSQCRMFVDAPGSIPLGDGQRFYPNMQTRNEWRESAPRMLPVATHSSR